MMAAQEIVELFCELIAVRLPIIEAQRYSFLCPVYNFLNQYFLVIEVVVIVCFGYRSCWVPIVEIV